MFSEIPVTQDPPQTHHPLQHHLQRATSSGLLWSIRPTTHWYVPSNSIAPFSCVTLLLLLSQAQGHRGKTLNKMAELMHICTWSAPCSAFFCSHCER